MHLTPLQFQRNQIRKKKKEMEGLAQGRRWMNHINESHQFPPGRDKYIPLTMTSLVWLVLWVCPHFPLKCVLPFSIVTFTFSTRLAPEFFLMQQQEVSHGCSRLSPLLDIPVSLCWHSHAEGPEHLLRPWFCLLSVPSGSEYLPLTGVSVFLFSPFTLVLRIGPCFTPLLSTSPPQPHTQPSATPAWNLSPNPPFIQDGVKIYVWDSIILD